MFLRILLFVCCSAILCVAAEKSSETDDDGSSKQFAYKRVCYYTNWAQYRPGVAKFRPHNIDVHLCTHINYAFVRLFNGKLTYLEWNDEKMIKEVTDLKTVKPSLKILASIGGWTAASKPFTRMIKTKKRRDAFIRQSINWIRDHEFDGLDIDWEYPGSRGSPPADKYRFVQLCSELRSAFESEADGEARLLLTAAFPASKKILDAGYDVKNLSSSFDFINLMAYDYHGSWEKRLGHNAPLYRASHEINQDAQMNIDWSIKYLIHLGLPSRKLVLGLPTYGRTFRTLNEAIQEVPKDETNSDIFLKLGNYIGDPALGPGDAGQYTKEIGFLGYFEICQKIQIYKETEMDRNNEVSSYFTRKWNPEQMVPYAFKGSLWIGYDDTESIDEKVKYIKKHKLGGAMVWAMDLDDFAGLCGIKYPLLKTVTRILVAKETTSSNQTIEETDDEPVDNDSDLTKDGLYKEYDEEDFNNDNQLKTPPVSQPSYEVENIVIDKIDKIPEIVPTLETKVKDKVLEIAPALKSTKKSRKLSKKTDNTMLEQDKSVDLEGFEDIDKLLSEITEVHPNCSENGELFPDPKNCSKYLICVHGKLDGKDCPSGLEFNAKVKACDWIDLANCSQAAEPEDDQTIIENELKNSNSASDSNGASEQCTDGDIKAHDLKCSLYLVCSNGIWYPNLCPQGLHFNPNLKACDWPKNAGCSSTD